MKRFFLMLFVIGAFMCAFLARAYENPGKPTGFVNDFAGMFSLDEKVALEVKLKAFEKETGSEISVVTVKDLGGDTGANFAVHLIEDWGIGKKGVNNGVLFLIAVAEHDVRIDVGYGLEPTVTDGAVSVILRTIVLPAFKDERYFGGIDAGTDKVMAIIKGDPEAMNFVANAATSAPSWTASVNWQGVAILVILIIVVSTRRGRRMLPFIFWSGIGRGGFGGGSSGGGFGGFGGGRSGGGGAGGKW